MPDLLQTAPSFGTRQAGSRMMPLAGLLRHYPAGRFTRQSMRTLGPAPNRPSFLQDNLGHGTPSDASAAGRGFPVSSNGNGNAAAAAGTATIGRGRCNVQSAESSRQTAATAANKKERQQQQQQQRERGQTATAQGSGLPNAWPVLSPSSFGPVPSVAQLAGATTQNGREAGKSKRQAGS
ncbi:hypothetical protein GCG54_00014770, partial [Colletotrichum gloeosporioides]